MNQQFNQLLELKQGCSKGKWKGLDVFFKHPTVESYAELDQVYEEYLEKTKGRVPNREEREKELKETGEWTQKDEDEISHILAQLDNSRKSLEQAVPQIQGLIEKQIEQLQEKLLKHQSRKALAFGKTAEYFANRYSNEYFIYNSSFKDKEMKELLLTEDEVDELSEADITNLLNSYNKALDKFSDKGLKDLAISPIISQYSSLEKNFFEAALLELTFFQLRLIILSQNYRSMLEHTPPGVDEDIIKDYDKLEEWHSSSEQNKDRMEAAIAREKNPTGTGWGAEQIRKNIKENKGQINPTTL